MNREEINAHLKARAERLQGLNFELIKLSSYNRFDGEQVVADLMAHRSLWLAAVMTDGADSSLMIRDIDRGYWNVSTLFLKTSTRYLSDLMQIIRDWHADDISVLDENEADQMLFHYGLTTDQRIVRLWWD